MCPTLALHFLGQESRLPLSCAADAFPGGLLSAFCPRCWMKTFLLLQPLRSYTDIFLTFSFDNLPHFFLQSGGLSDTFPLALFRTCDHSFHSSSLSPSLGVNHSHRVSTGSHKPAWTSPPSMYCVTTGWKLPSVSHRHLHLHSPEYSLLTLLHLSTDHPS